MKAGAAMETAYGIPGVRNQLPSAIETKEKVIATFGR